MAARPSSFFAANEHVGRCRRIRNGLPCWCSRGDGAANVPTVNRVGLDNLLHRATAVCVPWAAVCRPWLQEMNFGTQVCCTVRMPCVCVVGNRVPCMPAWPPMHNRCACHSRLDKIPAAPSNCTSWPCMHTCLLTTPLKAAGSPLQVIGNGNGGWWEPCLNKVEPPPPAPPTPAIRVQLRQNASSDEKEGRDGEAVGARGVHGRGAGGCGGGVWVTDIPLCVGA